MQEINIDNVITTDSGFGGLVLASGARVCGLKPGRSRRIFWAKKVLSTPSFVGEVKPSAPCRCFAAYKKYLTISVEVVIVRLNLIGHFSPIIPPLVNSGLTRRLKLGACGDDGGDLRPAAYGLGVSRL
jgi:hypothetical protein